MKTNEPCAIVQDLLPLYIEGICSAESSLLVETHLTTCPGCAQVHTRMRAQTDALIPDVDEAEIPVRHAWKQLAHSIRRRHMRTLVIGALVMVLLFIGGNLLYDHYFRVARVLIPYDELSLTLVQQPDGQVLASLTYVDGRQVPRLSMQHHFQTHTLYFLAYRPLMDAGAAGGDLLQTYIDQSLRMIDGTLYMKPVAASAGTSNPDMADTAWTDQCVIREVRLGTADAYVTVYRQGDEIPQMSP